MKSRDVVHLIEQYRHDILNHLQLVQGYISLGNIEKADISVTNLLEYFQQETDLLHLNMTNVYLWFLQFPIKYNDFQISYDIDIKKNLQYADDTVVEKLNMIMQDIEAITTPSNSYSLEIEFKDNLKACEIALYLKLESNGIMKEFLSKLDDIDRAIGSKEVVYRFQIPINNEVK